jgi:hypothetical protein
MGVLAGFTSHPDTSGLPAQYHRLQQAYRRRTLSLRSLRLDPQHQRHRSIRRGSRDLAAKAQRCAVEHPPTVAAA